MIEKKSPLGRGVNALFSKIKSNSFAYIDINIISTNPHQPRTNFSNSELKELAKSISEYGVIQPITVRKTKENKYQIISGERRFRACKLASINKIPVYIKETEDDKMLELALIENIQRQDLDPIEIGISYQKLIDELKLTQEKLAEKIGKKRSTINHFLRLLNLHPIIQAGLRDFMLTVGHAKCLLTITDKEKQLDYYNFIISKNLSVRETENLIKKNHKEKKHSLYETKFFKESEKKLEKILDMKIKIKGFKNGSGKLQINFQSERELNKIINVFEN
ncbi:MAG: chromosome partitioning protein ParB [Flavobacteriales bacterium]|nr:chromosome partitioning protein ParB [Flavobacteriales bacterium]